MSGDGAEPRNAGTGTGPTAAAFPVFRPRGLTLPLSTYPAATITNPQFAGFDLSRWDRVFLPPALAPLADDAPCEVVPAIEDDNRSAILPEAAATLDGTRFFLSIKGVGSSVDPFSLRRLDGELAAELTDRADVRERLRSGPHDMPGGIITGELWLRGSPYGGQGLPHALTSLRVSERATLTDLRGFRIAPVVKVVYFPAELEDRLRSIHWYRKFPDRIVQELRLVPSNVRVYFHARSTIGQDAGQVFDAFGLDSAGRAHLFEVNFVRSGIALLSLFARTADRTDGGRYAGLDFHDVWLDKDAVLAPDGTVYFVDLEGIDEVRVDASEVREKLEDQVYRSLYEFMYAYEQIERERARRFGGAGSRKRRFEGIVREALEHDPFARPREGGRGLVLEIRSRTSEEPLSLDFPLVDV